MAKKVTRKKPKPGPLRWWVVFDSSPGSDAVYWYVYVRRTPPYRLVSGDWCHTGNRIYVTRECQLGIPQRYRDEARRTGKPVLMTTLSE